MVLHIIGMVLHIKFLSTNQTDLFNNDSNLKNRKK